MENNQNKRPKLESAQDLKGKNAKSVRPVKKFAVLLVLLVVLGGACAIYYLTDTFTPEPEPEATQAPSTSVTLINREKPEFDRVTITHEDGETYTLVSNIEYDEEGNVVTEETPEPESTDSAEAEATPEPTAEPTAVAAAEPASTEATAETAAEPASTEAAAETAAEPASTEAAAETAAEPASTEAAAEPAATPAPTSAPVSAQMQEIVEQPIEQDYSIEGQDYFEVKTSLGSSMLTYATSTSATATVTENPENLADYGLDTPVLTANIQYKDGSETTLYFGDKLPTGSGVYVRMDDSQTVYSVSTSALNAFNKRLNDLHTVDLPLTPSANTFMRVLIEQTGKETVEIVMDSESDGLSISSLKMVQPIEYDVHSTRFNEITEALTALSLDSYAGHVSTVDELEQYGLKTPAAYIHYEDSEGAALDLRVGNAVDDLNYVTVDDTGDIYFMESSDLSFLSNVNASYLVDQFANLVNIVKVDRLVVEGNGQSYELAIERETTTNEEGEEEEVETYLFDGEVTEESPFKKLYQEVIGLLFDKLSDDDNVQGDVVASVRYELNTGMEDFVVEYVTYDDDYYAIRRDGKTQFLIKQSKVLNMLDQCQAYRDGTFVDD